MWPAQPVRIEFARQHVVDGDVPVRHSARDAGQERGQAGPRAEERSRPGIGT